MVHYTNYIKCTILATRDFDLNHTVVQDGQENCVIIRLTLNGPQLFGKVHRLNVKTPYSEKVQTVALEEKTVIAAQVVDFTLKNNIFDRNGIYFIQYQNQDGVSDNWLKIIIKNYVDIPGVGSVQKILYTQVDLTDITFVEILESVNGLYVEANTGRFHFIKPDGTELIVDLEVESILDPNNPPYWDEENARLVITFLNGAVVYIPLNIAVIDGGEFEQQL